MMPAVVPSFWLLCLVLRLDPSLSSCTPSVRVLDMHCLLQWNCSNINSSTTFVVQTKDLGGEWQNISECFQISTNSCDVSQAFSSVILLNFVRLGLNHGHKGIDWTPAQFCMHLGNPDASFSPPSVSVSVKGPKLLVDVAFPCAPSVLCQSESYEEDDDEAADLSCCPLTNFLQLNTTVTLYNKHDVADTQTHTKVFEDSPSQIEFGWLVPGQEYCTVAQFASSPLSEPQCVHVPSWGSLNVAASCGMLIAFLLVVVCFLGKRWASADTSLPKSLMSLQDVDQESPFVGESGQAALEEDENLVFLSIVPLYNTPAFSKPETQSACLSTQSLEDGYYGSTILQNQALDEQPGDSDSHVEMDGDAPQDHYLGPMGNVDIPLSSVKVAGGQREEMELYRLHDVLTNMMKVGDSQLVTDGDHGE